MALERGRLRLCGQIKDQMPLSLQGLWKNLCKSLKQGAKHVPAGAIPEQWILQRLAKQFRNYVLVGFAATAAHYAVLVALMESGLVKSVPATLAGYLVGGVVSYHLNRNHAFESNRPHQEAVWRFVVVAAVGFFVTGFLMALLNEQWGLHYLFAQVISTGFIMLWSFVANRIWTFKPDKAGD